MSEDNGLRLFLNRLRCLYNVDRDHLEKAFGHPVHDKLWTMFRDDPVRQFLRMDDERQAALWLLMCERYPG